MSRSDAWIVVAVVCAMVGALAAEPEVFAQAGSTGGTIGKHDKSVSGSSEVEQSQRTAKRPKHHSGVTTRQKDETKTFDNPTIDGIRVDHCWHFATECDEPAATEWCRSKGFNHATEWKWENLADTIGQSDKRRCPMPGWCGGFSKITCE